MSHKARAIALMSAAAAAYALIACTTTPTVATITADGANLTGYHTFSMMTAPPATATTSTTNTSPAGGATVASGGDVSSTNQMDPMLASSPVGSAIRTDIVQSFKGRGYGESSAPDFLVAYYAGTGDIVTIKAYPYGYSGMSNTGKVNITDYPAGSVIVDVVDAKTQQLVWRGQGTSKIPSDADMYSRQLAVTIRDIIQQFPKAGQQKS